ncbi:MAG: hypothetical protein WD002_06815 [Pseudomonadales bacterium]
MKPTLIGITVATIVLYIWGYLYWGISPIPYESMNQTPDDAAAQESLRQHFPESGSYLLPGPDHEPDVLNELYANGPIAIIHIKLEGGPVMDPAVLVRGFIHNLAFVGLLAIFFKVAAAREFRDFARLSLISGAVAVVLIDAGDIIWWRETISWNVWQAIYNFTAFLIAGHLLGVFMKTNPEASTA